MQLEADLVYVLLHQLMRQMTIDVSPKPVQHLADLLGLLISFRFLLLIKQDLF
jgi:hypothetical protein